jgi:hypothetical protein
LISGVKSLFIYIKDDFRILYRRQTQLEKCFLHMAKRFWHITKRFFHITKRFFHITKRFFHKEKRLSAV